VHNPHLRWLGPEKGVMHMAIGAVINAAWDLAAKRAGLPVWLLLAELDTDQVIDLIDFSWLTDALTPDDVRETLDRTASDRQERVETLQRQGFPAYTTTPGWLGYTDDKLDRLCREAVADGFDLVKLKVGADVEDDLRRLEIARAAVGSDVRIAVDANQHWAVDEAIAWMRRLAPTAPYWIEEPTHPDDILGHARIRQAIAPIRVATGEHVANRVMVKQLLQAGAIDILQIDATRVGGINENLAHLFLAAKFGVPVCPHAGGVGLCEVVQHLAMYDAVAVAGGVEGRVLEFVDHLHEHFVTPVVLRDASYVPPSAPGLGSQMLAASMAEFAFPDGPVWASASESSQRRNS
jgi:L-fuconate dehydratase